MFIDANARVAMFKITCERDKLYEEVWAEPLRDVARRYGVSDVGLAKICKRLNVPVPGRGYWAQRSAGQDVDRSPLKPLRAGEPSTHIIEKWTRPASSVLTDEARSLSEKERDPGQRIVVLDLLDDPLPLVRQSASMLRKLAKVDHPSYPTETCLDIQVTSAQLDRALRIFDALLKASSARGYAVTTLLPNLEKVRYYRYGTTHTLTQIVVGEDKVEVGIIEGFKSVIVQPPRRKSTVGGHFYTPSPERQRQYNGELTLKIKNTVRQHSIRRSWGDGNKKRLEDQLNAVMAGMIAAAEVVRAERLESERQERARLEQQRLRDEQERLRRHDEENIAVFKERIANQSFTRELRQHVAETRKIIAEGDCKPSDDFAKLLAWADDYVERTDPLACLRREIDAHKRDTKPDDPSR